MPSGNPIIPNLSINFNINYIYGSNVDPTGRMSTPWSMMGGRCVPCYHTHTTTIAPSIVSTPMIFAIEGIVVRNPTNKVLVSALMTPWKTNSTKDRRFVDICSFKTKFGISFGWHQCLN